MNVVLMSASSLTPEFLANLSMDLRNRIFKGEISPRQIIALSAIRTCYSAAKPSEIANLEFERYFGKAATDGEGGTDADRLFRHIFRSKHTSTLESITYTFAIEGLSRAALAQLTRHRQFSFSVQSQRYVRFGSDDKSGGFDYVMPPAVRDGSNEAFESYMKEIQSMYDTLREMGVPAEDARMVLPQAAACNLVLTGNLRAILEFYGKRKAGRGAQWEIADLAEKMRGAIIEVDGWTERFFDEV